MLHDEGDITPFDSFPFSLCAEKIRDKADKSTLAFLMPLMDELEAETKADPSLKEDNKIDVRISILLFTSPQTSTFPALSPQ